MVIIVIQNCAPDETIPLEESQRHDLITEVWASMERAAMKAFRETSLEGEELARLEQDVRGHLQMARNEMLVG